MFASFFEVLIVKPIFNFLVFIYALLPGHNFGLAIILFTIAVRFLMWPLVKKQLHQAKAMRELQPELKRIKQAAKGNRQRESALLMELYKEREISPFGSIGTLIIQLIILIGLYSGLRKVVDHPDAIISYSYSWLHNLSWLKTLAADIGRFDSSLFGVVDLTKPAIKDGVYFPGMLLVLGSCVAQYLQSKQLLPVPKERKSLKRILSEASAGKQPEQGEMAAATSQWMLYLTPFLIFIFTVNLPSALSLYWLVTGITAYFQQAKILKQDETELEAAADKTTTKTVIEGEIVTKKPAKTKKPSKKKTSSKKRKKK